MSFIASALRERPILRGALIVPSVIALIFSLFNLSAAPDPAALASHITIAAVNHDAGLPFPPINVVERMISGLSQRLPMHLQAYGSDAEARAALEAEDVQAVLIFSQEFSLSVSGSDPVPLTLITSGSLTMAESQLTGALPRMLESGVAAAGFAGGFTISAVSATDDAISGIRPCAIASRIDCTSARIAPFVAGFAIALAAMVGGIIGWVGTRGLGSLRALRLRVIFPVVAMPVAALVMASIVAGFAGSAFVGLWLAIALLGIAFGWFAAGALALVGPVALLVLVPLVFWQTVLGGAQVPMTAAPVWLHWLAPLGIDQIGAHYRSLIIAGGHPFPWGLAPGAAVLGLGMQILRALLVRGRVPVTA